MRLLNAVKYFGNEPIEVWNGSSWEVVPQIQSSVQTFDRFLGPRSFGQRQRILLVGSSEDVLDGYEFIRLSNGERYIILSHNQDMEYGEAYGVSYVIQKAPYDASVMQLVTETAPSGLGGTTTPTQVATTFCDMERYTSEGSSEADTVRYGIFTMLFPLSMKGVVTTDSEILIDGVYYEVKEVSPLLEILEIRTLQRGV